MYLEFFNTMIPYEIQSYFFIDFNLNTACLPFFKKWIFIVLPYISLDNLQMFNNWENTVMCIARDKKLLC